MDAGAVVETTGAGDAFNGGLAVALTRGLAPREAVRFANAVAGISVTRAGTASSMPSRDEVEALLQRPVRAEPSPSWRPPSGTRRRVSAHEGRARRQAAARAPRRQHTLPTAAPKPRRPRTQAP